MACPVPGRGLTYAKSRETCSAAGAAVPIFRSRLFRFLGGQGCRLSWRFLLFFKKNSSVSGFLQRTRRIIIPLFHL